MYERLHIGGLPCYPSLALQYALARVGHRWRTHSLLPAPVISAEQPAQQYVATTALASNQGHHSTNARNHHIHVLGTNHLLPWYACQVARSVQLSMARYTAPYRTIAVELPSNRAAAIQQAAQLLEPALAELAHPRFYHKMPDVRALQRLMGQATREAVAQELEEGLGLDAMALRIFGFVEGMELLMAFRMARLHSVPLVCIDNQPTGSTDAAHGSTGLGTDTGSSDVSSTGCSAGITTMQGVGGMQQQQQQQCLAGHGTMSDSSQQASDGRQQQHHLNLHSHLQHQQHQHLPTLEVQAAWQERAWETLEHGVDRGLVVGDEYACMGSYIDAWGEPAALAHPAHFHAAKVCSTAAGAGASAVIQASVHSMHWQREQHMAEQLLHLPGPVLAVVGAAHVVGVRSALQTSLQS